MADEIDNDDVQAGGLGMTLDEVVRAYASQIPREQLEALHIKTTEALVKSREERATMEASLRAAEERATAAESRATAAEGLLREADEVFALCTTRDFSAPEDAEVRAMGERLGFGAVMSAASKGWADMLREHHPEAVGGQFTCGPCAATVDRIRDRIAAHLEGRS